MKLLYIRNSLEYGSPYNSIKGWQGWSMELNDGSRIQLQSDSPDNSIVGCLVKAALEIGIDQSLLDIEMLQICRNKILICEVWGFLLNDDDMKTVFFAMMDWAYDKSGASEDEFKRYVEIYRSK